MMSRLAATVALAAVMIAACSSTSSPRSTGGDGGSSGGGSCPSSPVTTPYFGYLDSAGGPPFSFSAGFSTPSLDLLGTGCSGTQAGSCCYLAPGSDAGIAPCPAEADAGLPMSGTPADAGTITVTDGSTTLSMLMAQTASDIYQDSSQTNSALVWTPGDTLTVAATGGIVQAFSVSMRTPHLIAGPALGSTQVTMSIGADYTVTWTPDSVPGALMTLDVTPRKGGLYDGIIRCTVDDNAGTVTVPKSLLGNISTSDTGLVSLSRIVSSISTEPDVTLQLAAGAGVDAMVTFTP
jgi:hypothetical protein